MNEDDIRCVKICGEEIALNCNDACVCFKPTPVSRKVADFEVHDDINGEYPIIHYQCLLRHHSLKAGQVTSDKLIPLFPYIESLNRLESMF